MYKHAETKKKNNKQLTASAIDLLGRDGGVFEVHRQVRRYLQMDQRYGGERQHELRDGQAHGERFLGNARWPPFDARLVQPDRSDVHHVHVLVQQKWHHYSERHQPDEYQRLSNAAPEYRAPRIAHYREVPVRNGKNDNNANG